MGGYGIANINWVKYLKRAGVDVSVHGKFAPKQGSMEWDMLTPEEQKMFIKDFELRKIGLIETNPFDFEINKSEIKIANTMCETDSLGPEWKEKLNTMDYIIVPNQFCKDVFEKVGVTKPVTVIPHGVDASRYPYYDRPEREYFTFGILGYLDVIDRKGVFDVIRAFSSEFAKDEKVQLVIHSSNPSFGYYRRFTDSRITVDIDAWDQQQVNEFYQQIDCFVFPSKAEGIGYPPREAMATGLPTILTAWSGLSDIAKEEISYPIYPAGFEPRPDFIHQRGNWAKINIQELMYQMRYVYEHRQEARSKGLKASEYIGQVCSWPVATGKLIEFLEGVRREHASTL